MPKHRIRNPSFYFLSPSIRPGGEGLILVKRTWGGRGKWGKKIVLGSRCHDPDVFMYIRTCQADRATQTDGPFDRVGEPTLLPEKSRSVSKCPAFSLPASPNTRQPLQKSGQQATKYRPCVHCCNSKVPQKCNMQIFFFSYNAQIKFIVRILNCNTGWTLAIVW